MPIADSCRAAKRALFDHSFGQPSFMQTFQKPLPIGHSRERPNKTLIARGQFWHTMQQLIQCCASGCSISQMSIGRSGDRVNVGKFWIRFASVSGKLDRLFVPLGQQCRPAFAEMPDDHQQASRAEASGQPLNLVKNRPPPKTARSIAPTSGHSFIVSRSVPIVSATSVALNRLELRCEISVLGCTMASFALRRGDSVKNLGLRFSASVPTPRSVSRVEFARGRGHASSLLYLIISSPQCESYREFEAGAGRVSFAAVRISSLTAR